MARPLRPTALVTGGNRGIGRAIAAGLKARGCSVTLAARDPDEGRRAAFELRRLLPPGVTVVEDAVRSKPTFRTLGIEYHKLLARVIARAWGG